MTNPMSLGDGAYVHFREEDGSVVLTTGHHDPAQAENEVVLGTAELDAFLVWLGAMRPMERQTSGENQR